MPETAIFDHYEVLTRDDGSLFELGRGAMGITYKAFDTSLRMPVALKVINATYLNSEVARQRFVREARSAAKLRHRNVATVFHLGTEGDTWFYAMEFIDGETLDGLIKRQGPLTPTMALAITAQVARALNAAAQQGLVHRDIKPANLMLVKEDDDLVAKVIDFGLAKTSVAGEGEDAATLSMGGFVGTPHFASPEQLEEREIDVRSDIYSLGVTLWYMLAGQAPFAGSMAQVMSQHLSKPPPFEKLERLPRSVSDVLRKMLAKDPEQRFQTPTDLRKAIEDALVQIADSPTVAAPRTLSEENFATLLEDSAMPSGMGSFETNTIIAGRYRVAESLGDTNAGRLFHAYDTQQQREVRLIVLPPAALGDPAALTALEREVEKLANVRHPNLLGVIDFETVDRGSFLVLEWTDGFSLLDLLKARRELEADEALKLLAQAAAGVDHALSLGLNGLEFGLHQVQLHFPQAIEKEKLLRAALGTWPAFEVKLYPLGATRDIATSQTWAGGQTMVGGAESSAADGGDARPRYLQALAAVVYEILGGTLSPLVLRGAGGPTMRYTPLSTLSEEGNEVLKRALDPARSFASAKEFSEALGRLDGLQVSHREMKASIAPARPAATRTPPAPARAAASSAAPFVPPQPRKAPLALIGGAAAIIVAGVVAAFFLQKSQEPKPAEPETHFAAHEAPEVTPRGEFPTLVDDAPPPATPIPAIPVSSTPAPFTPAPTTPPPAPTRHDMLKAAVSRAEEFEERGDWEKSLRGFLQIAKDYPEFAVGKNHLETLLEHLRERPSPISAQEFRELRTLITEAAELDVLAAMMLLADNTREQEPVIAFNWYSAAAARDHAPAMTQLGLMFSNTTVPGTPDLIKAVQCFEAAAEKGDSAAKAALGDCYLLGKGVPAKDEKRALELYRESVASGDVRAMNRLGDVLHKLGSDALKNNQSGKAYFAEAFQLFTKASERGSLDALGNLGVMHLRGQGVPVPDQKKAAALFEKGAKGGNAFCMWLYAVCLDDGLGVVKSQLQATTWYRKAAEAGDRRAAEWCRKNSVPFTPKG
jgi:serine/threonine protein kinase/TPR repeat protein